MSYYVFHCYVHILLELSDPQANTVVCELKERKYLLFFIAIGTSVLLLNEYA